jgi:hypothetical protein
LAIWGGCVVAARIGAEHTRRHAVEAVREAVLAKAQHDHSAWKALAGLRSRCASQNLNGVYGWLRDHRSVGARQVLQCVGQIKIGSSAQALGQTPNLRRNGKRSGATPVLSSSPTSKLQSSGASWMGSHGTAPCDIWHLQGACNQCRHPPLETADLFEGVLSL